MPTKRQKQILDFITSFQKKKSFAPSFEEIKKHLKLSSVSTIHFHIKKLQDEGFLNKGENSPRSISVFESQQMVKIPLMGTIAAGQPIEAIQVKETIAIPKTKVMKGGNFYALRVVGNSMIDENINDGDVVLVKEQQFAKNGQKVVALIDNYEATLKTFYKERNQIRLQPANKEYEPIIIKKGEQEIIIQGLVVDIIKNIDLDFSKKLTSSKPTALNEKKFIGENQIVCGDAIKLLDEIKPDSVYLVLSDIPYGISLDDWDVLHANTNSALLGKSPAQEGKNAFKRRGKPINGWSSADRNIPKEYQDWCYSWANKLFPLVKEGGSLFIFGARRTLHRALVAFEESGFLVRDVLAWEKSSAHHRAQAISGILEKRGLTKEAREWEGWKLGNLAPIYEPIAWLFKPYQITITDNVLKNGVGAMNVEECLIEGKSPTNILKFGFERNEGNFHEAQKPVALLEYLIRLTTRENQVVLDPFMGSGSTLVAAKKINRKYIGFDTSDKYCDIAKKRINEKYTTLKSTKNKETQSKLF
ncbi:transcriptional repressor LexA [Patescibacteria group bacterium]|nr:transcriptional repressor LexA [Patescibacteria group bacterium]MBU2416652.1 transcriptional repressor LexA [Patescibacteria group bacterium]